MVDMQEGFNARPTDDDNVNYFSGKKPFQLTF